MDNVAFVDSPEDCLDLCSQTLGCSWATYFGEDNGGACLLTSDCQSFEECPGCHLGNANVAADCGDGGSNTDHGNIQGRERKKIKNQARFFNQ